MNVPEFIERTNLERSLLIGYYGGGNYGDELLLETLQNLFRQSDVQDVTIAYQHPPEFGKLHHDLGYGRIEIRDRLALLKATRRSRCIIIGGGGLWGVDINLNTILMSVYLLICRRLLGKKVYLLGVGYYNSTTGLGRLAAWCAAKAANRIFARDSETYANFLRLNNDTVQDQDMAHYSGAIDLDDYADDLRQLDDKLQVSGRTLFVTLRRLQGHKAAKNKRYTDVVTKIIAANTDKPVIVALLESEAIDKDNYALARSWSERYDNVRLLDFPHNPVALMAFFKSHHEQLVLVGIQFHIIITAHLTGVPYLPVSYDNKVSELLKQLGRGDDVLAVEDLEQFEVQSYVDRQFGVAGRNAP